MKTLLAKTHEHPAKPTLLFNDECGVCRRIANWVKKSDKDEFDKASLVVRPIGDDPQALRALNPDLEIWEAYATIHLVMTDGTMKRGGEAVAEVFRRLPNTKWFARLFTFGTRDFRPFQSLLNAGYAVLAASRPIFGCESCGMPHHTLRPLAKFFNGMKEALRGRPAPARHRHSTLLPRAKSSLRVAS